MAGYEFIQLLYSKMNTGKTKKLSSNSCQDIISVSSTEGLHKYVSHCMYSYNATGQHCSDNGLMYGWMDRLIKWVYGWVGKWAGVRIDKWVCVGVWMDGWVDR